jgi:hypothetical protein
VRVGAHPDDDQADGDAGGHDGVGAPLLGASLVAAHLLDDRASVRALARLAHVSGSLALGSGLLWVLACFEFWLALGCGCVWFWLPRFWQH